MSYFIQSKLQGISFCFLPFVKADSSYDLCYVSSILVILLQCSKRLVLLKKQPMQAE